MVICAHTVILQQRYYEGDWFWNVMCVQVLSFFKNNVTLSLMSKNFWHCNRPTQVCCQKPSMTSSVTLLPHYDRADCYTFVICIIWHFVQSFTDRTKVVCCLGASDFVGGRSEIGNKMDAKGKGIAPFTGPGQICRATGGWGSQNL